MKHRGKARAASFKLIFLALAIVVAVALIGLVAKYAGSFLVAIFGPLVFLWAVFTIFTLYFFRDPTPTVPAGPGPVRVVMP